MESVVSSGETAPLLTKKESGDSIASDPSSFAPLTEFLKTLPALSADERALFDEILKKLLASSSETTPASPPSPSTQCANMTWKIIKAMLDGIFAVGYGSLAYSTIFEKNKSVISALFFAAASMACNAAQGWYALDLPAFYEKLFKKLSDATKCPTSTGVALTMLTAALAYWSIYPSLPLLETLESDLSRFPLTAWVGDYPAFKTFLLATMTIIRDALFVKSLLNVPVMIYECFKEAWDNWIKHDNEEGTLFNILSFLSGASIGTLYSLGQIPKVQMMAPALHAEPEPAGYAALVPLLALNSLFITKGFAGIKKLDAWQARVCLIIAGFTGWPGVALLNDAPGWEQACSYGAAMFSNYASLINLEFVADPIKTKKILQVLDDLKEEIQCHSTEASTASAEETQLLDSIDNFKETIKAKTKELESQASAKAKTVPEEPAAPTLWQRVFCCSRKNALSCCDEVAV